LLFVFAIVGLAVASAKTYTVTLFQPAVVAGTELKPGDYKLEVNHTKVVLKKGKQKVETAVKVETSESRFPATTVRFSNGDGKYTVREIWLGGTNTRLVFD
jgi:hypothetical protein